MGNNIEHIGKRDIAWSYASTAITIGAGVILMPFILHRMSAETVGIWNIIQTVTYLVMMVDFGFRPSFSRSISYIFSGVRRFDKQGVRKAESNEADYGLLADTIAVMRRLYRYMAIGIFVLLMTAGTAYFQMLMSKYSGDLTDAWTAWGILVFVSAFNLYTYYYDALLEGKGYIRQNRQITIVAMLTYLVTAIVLIECGFGLSAIVSAQLLNILVKRILSYRVFYTSAMRAELSKHESTCSPIRQREILAALTPNAVRSGLTGLGGFVINKSAMLIGGAFLGLEVLAMYGLTLQCLDVLNKCGSVIYQAYIPRLAQARAQRDYKELARIYKLNVLSILFIYLTGGVAWLLLGDWALALIGSQTQFVPTAVLLVMLAANMLEVNHANAAGFIQADNRIPFFIPSLVSGAATLVLMWVFLGPMNMDIWGLALAPALAQLCYQNWRWPSMLIQEIRQGLKA